jgi:hypothetical protein
LNFQNIVERLTNYNEIEKYEVSLAKTFYALFFISLISPTTSLSHILNQMTQNYNRSSTLLLISVLQLPLSDQNRKNQEKISNMKCNKTSEGEETG